MPTLKSIIILDLEWSGWEGAYYLYKSQEEDEQGRKTVGGVYILKSEIDGDPPHEINISLEWK